MYVSSLNSSLLSWLTNYIHFFTPSLPSTIISLHTNLRKCSHFSCICLFPTPFSGLQFIKVLIYASAQIVFCFSHGNPVKPTVLTGFYYSPRHIFLTFGHMKVFQFYLLYLLCPSPGIRHSSKKLLFLLVGMGT